MGGGRSRSRCCWKPSARPARRRRGGTRRSASGGGRSAGRWRGARSCAARDRIGPRNSDSLKNRLGFARKSTRNRTEIDLELRGVTVTRLGAAACGPSPFHSARRVRRRRGPCPVSNPQRSDDIMSHLVVVWSFSGFLKLRNRNASGGGSGPRRTGTPWTPSSSGCPASSSTRRTSTAACAASSGWGPPSASARKRVALLARWHCQLRSPDWIFQESFNRRLDAEILIGAIAGARIEAWMGARSELGSETQSELGSEVRSSRCARQIRRESSQGWMRMVVSNIYQLQGCEW